MRNGGKNCCGCTPKAETLALLWCTMVCCIVGIYLTNYQLGKLPSVIDIQQWMWLFENNFCRGFLVNLFIIIAVVSIAGLHGIYTDNASLLMPYIIYRTVVDVLIVIGFFPLILIILEKFLKNRYGNYSENDHDSFDHIFIVFIVAEFLYLAIEIHFIKVILRCYDLMELSSKVLKNEVLTLSNLRGSSPNGKFHFKSDNEMCTAV